MKIMLDIDGTITAVPSLFSVVSQSEIVERCIIVSSRTNSDESRVLTEEQLSELGINYDKLYLLEDCDHAHDICPHQELDWLQKYLWQKVNICLNEGVDIAFEDDERVIELFKRFAPNIQVLQVHTK